MTGGPSAEARAARPRGAARPGLGGRRAADRRGGGAGAGKPPPAGAASRAGEPAAADRRRPRRGGREPSRPGGASPEPESEAELLLALLRSLRDVIPPELQHRLGEALREVLLALRALIDWYLERTERRRREPAEVQDIPIS